MSRQERPFSPHDPWNSNDDQSEQDAYEPRPRDRGLSEQLWRRDRDKIYPDEPGPPRPIIPSPLLILGILVLLIAGIAIGLNIPRAGSSTTTSLPTQALSAGCQAASARTPSPVTQITSVSFSGGSGSYSLTISGEGFGNAPFPSMPYTGDSPDFRIADKAQLGFGEHGYSGDALMLNYESWSVDQIRVSGLNAAPGDALEIGLWNQATNAAASWGGDIPPAQSSPMISSVCFSGGGQNLKMVIRGSGFGNTPIAMPYTGTLNYFDFADYREHCGGSTAFEAGSARWGHGPDSVALVYQSWTDNEIIISSFGQPYGQGCVIAEPDDPFTITIWASTDTGQTGPQTAWGGFLP